MRACYNGEKNSLILFSGEPSFKGNQASLSFDFTCDVEFLLSHSHSLVVCVCCCKNVLTRRKNKTKYKSNCRKELRFPVSISILPILMCWTRSTDEEKSFFYALVYLPDSLAFIFRLFVVPCYPKIIENNTVTKNSKQNFHILILRWACAETLRVWRLENWSWAI